MCCSNSFCPFILFRNLTVFSQRLYPFHASVLYRALYALFESYMLLVYFFNSPYNDPMKALRYAKSDQYRNLNKFVMNLSLLFDLIILT